MSATDGGVISCPSGGASEYEDLHPSDSDVDDTDDETCRDGLPYIPYSQVHTKPFGFEDLRRKLLISNYPVHVKIIDTQRLYGTNIMNPNLYTIKLQHGNFEWVIKKRFKHFHRLHQQLLLFRASLSFPLPGRRYREQRKSYRSKDRRSLPSLPRRPDVLVQQEHLAHRSEQLEQYLRKLLKIPLYRSHYETMNFLEIGPLSFINELGEKGREGLVLKRSGGHVTKPICLKLRRAITNCCGFWRKRWLVVKDNFVAYIRPKNGVIKSVLLMDNSFSVECGMAATGVHHGLLISNMCRQLLVKCWTGRKAREWMQHMAETANTLARDYTQRNRYDSFAPVRDNVEARWFIDGGTYFEAVADALEAAKVEIFIADWWLSPEIYLRRPVIQGELWRLDRVLQRKAEEGVKVFVLLYKEVELALGINSLYSKQTLAQLHPNIKVLRHPDHVRGGILFWAHHEKLVVVDQMYAFLGGIDLCYGRWDDYLHRLTDLGGIIKTNQSTKTCDGQFLPRRCCSTSDLSDTSHLENCQKIIIQARQMPEIKIQRHHSNESLSDPCGTEIKMADDSPQLENSSETRHVPSTDLLCTTEDERDASKKGKDMSDGISASRPRFASKLRTQRIMQAVAHFQALKHRLQHKDYSQDSLKMGALGDNLSLPGTELRRTASEIALHQMGLEGSCKLWFGKDYSNFILKDFVNLDRPYQDLVDRTTTPRMPWHDIGVLVQGTAAKDVARHFIQRWNFTKMEKAKSYDNYPWLIPKSTCTFSNIPPLPKSSTGELFCTNCQVWNKHKF